MPKYCTKFREDWLSLIDKSGTKCSDWCVKGKDEYSVYCLLCKTTVSVGNSGKIQLMQHSASSKHKSLDVARKDSSQSRLVSSPGGKGIHLNIRCEEQKKPWTLNQEDLISRAEIIWIINVALNNYSFQSCNSIKDIFTEMFQDSSIPKSLKMSARKVSYTISHGLGPYFLKQITDEFHEENPYFTLTYDETLNEQHSKQLDIYIRYWSSKNQCIEERYLGSELLGHATALDISSGIMDVLKSCGIDLKRLIMLGSDGPNVNKSVFQLINKEVLFARKSGGLLSIGTCNLHIVHNAFGNGLKLESFANIIDFLENIYCWFAKFPSRQEDLNKTMEALNCEFSKVLRFVSNRWLSVVQVCTRTLELLPALKPYFIELRKEKSRLIKHDRYISIEKVLNSELTSIYLNFLISVGSLFEEFLKFLQQKSTLIHMLYDELSKLLMKLMRRFMKEDVLNEKSGEELLNLDLKKEALNAKYIDVGNSAKRELSALKNSDLKAEFLANAKHFYLSVAIYLQERLPLANKLLQNLQVLHPLVRKVALKKSLPSIKRLCNMMPQVIPKTQVDKVADEWTQYVYDSDICEAWESESIDKFWSKVFEMKTLNNDRKYPFLTTLVKATLTMSHGQATIERGFSINKKTLTSERSSLNLDTLRGIRFIKDSVHSKASDVDITQEMLLFYKEAHSKYNAQKEKEAEKKKKVDVEKNNNIAAESNVTSIKDCISSAQSMIDEGNERLKQGLKRKNIKDMEVAQALIDAGNKKLKLANKKVNEKSN